MLLPFEMSSNMQRELCATCKEVVDSIRVTRWHSNILHHQSFLSLERSAEANCCICTEVFNQIQDRVHLQNLIFPIKCESDTSSARWQRSFELNLTSDGIYGFSIRFIFEVIEESTNNSAAYEPASSTYSPKACDLMNYWLTDCIQNHTRCNASPAERWAPTRLLDVGLFDDHLVKLVDGKDAFLSNQKYATLSHCWGRDHGRLFRTTRDNVKQLQQGVSCDEFPKTFRDSIKVARKFHLRYLWIDSLCIVQDDDIDRAIEVSLMEKVYRYSFINIAATGAKGSAEGCFWERNPHAVLPTEIFICWSNHQESKRKYRVVPEPKIWARKLTDEPLNRRAWVLQERILSPRVLHFGHEQLFWECREFSACETYHHGLPATLRGHPLIDIKKLQLGDEAKDNRWPTRYTSEAERSGSFIERLWKAFKAMLQPVIVHEITLYTKTASALAFRDWDAVVELYSMADMTYYSDRLIALSGIASSLSTAEPGASPDGYLAGLWQSSLPVYLLWIPEFSKDARDRSLDEPVAIPERYGGYVAPTWSWASLKGKISFTWCQHNYDPNDHLAVLEEASISHQTSFRFGHVTSGLIKLSSPVASVLWCGRVPPNFPVHKTGNITHIFPPHLNRMDSVSVLPHPDSDPEIFFDTFMTNSNSSDELTLLPIVGVTKRTIYENETVIGLVLEQSARTKEFQRIGFFYTTRPQVQRILRNMPRRSITIV